MKSLRMLVGRGGRMVPVFVAWRSRGETRFSGVEETGRRRIEGELRRNEDAIVDCRTFDIMSSSSLALLSYGLHPQYNASGGQQDVQTSAGACGSCVRAGGACARTGGRARGGDK